MSDLLSRLLSERDWLMADGATGTNLFNMGLTAGEPPEFWNTDRADDIRSLYRGAVEAGSDLFLTNTFGGNASRLKLHGAQGRVRELNRVGAEIGRAVGPGLRIVGFDDIEEAAHAWPPLSSVRCDIAGFGKTMADTVLAWLEEGKVPPAETRTPVSLVVRRSSAEAAAG